MYRKAIVLSVILCMLSMMLGGCYLFPKEEEILAPPLIEPAEITYDTVKAKKGDIERKITGPGTFISTKRIPVFFKNRGGRFKTYHVEIGDEVEEGQLLAELITDNIESDVKRQKIALRKAQLNYQRIKSSGGDKYSLEMADLDVKLAQIALDDLEQELEEAKLCSPIDGQVVYVDTKLSPGDHINTYASIIDIADPSNMQLEYSGNNASDFKVGMEVVVEIENDIYKGEVMTTPADMPEDAEDRLKNSVLIDVVNLPEHITMGDRANITLILERKEDVLVIPKNVIHSYMGRQFVKVLDGDVRREIDIETGIETPTEVEVIKGLEGDEQIIVQ